MVLFFCLVRLFIVFQRYRSNRFVQNLLNTTNYWENLVSEYYISLCLNIIFVFILCLNRILFLLIWELEYFYIIF